MWNEEGGMTGRAEERLICFDLGGVLARICSNWGDVGSHSGLLVRPEVSALPLSEAPLFDAYQHGQASEVEYLGALAEFLGIEQEDALRAHNAILVEPYPNTLEFVHEVITRGFATGCLSNTNAPHFAVLTDPARFPAIAALKHKLASHDLRLEKPDQAIFREFESRTGYAAQQITFFEDTLVNVEGARRAGWTAVQIDPHGDPARQMRDTLGL